MTYLIYLSNIFDICNNRIYMYSDKHFIWITIFIDRKSTYTQIISTYYKTIIIFYFFIYFIYGFFIICIKLKKIFAIFNFSHTHAFS
jgi:hypothetical protein